ncbi:T9SS type A sorting domain-containing protein [Ferruginibacter albus]|uniref:T9SS type A sorting domain-containing protein n=1 Tax=Ferruginibacter albus TaxID=2875540 RepID=UPI001CC5B2C8|nr:T9SS type A sorting domain-containing protein [Ferruginibacter albus]UAY53153.1 T9SS type A sorting domain-containing protein [Ferruginibacter albus]
MNRFSICTIALIILFSLPAKAQLFQADLYLLYNDGSTYPADGAVAQYNNAFSAGVDYLDAAKLHNINEEFSFRRDGYLLSIERRPIIHVRDTLFFNLTKTTQRKYQFQLTTTNLTQPNLVCFLKDAYTGDSVAVDLNGVTSYDFSIDNTIASQDAARFMVVFNTLPDAGPLPVTFTNIKAVQQNSNVTIEWKIANEVNIASYSIERSSDGQSFASIATIKSNGASIYDLTDMTPANGENYYRVRCTDRSGNIQYSEITTIKLSSNNHDIVIYPNPVKNGTVNLKMNNVIPGNYSFKLLSVSGQLLANKQLYITAGNTHQTIQLNNDLPKGLYQLEVIKPGNKKSSYPVQMQ